MCLIVYVCFYVFVKMYIDVNYSCRQHTDIDKETDSILSYVSIKPTIERICYYYH
jgi:hypothetical protein